MANYTKPSIKRLLTYAISPLNDAEEYHESNNPEGVIKCIKTAKEELMSLAEIVSIKEEHLRQWIDAQRQDIERHKGREGLTYGETGLIYGDSGFDLEAVHFGMTKVLDALEEKLKDTFGR